MKKRCSKCCNDFRVTALNISTWAGAQRAEYRICNFLDVNGMACFAINDTTSEVFCPECFRAIYSSSSINMQELRTVVC